MGRLKIKLTLILRCTVAVLTLCTAIHSSAYSPSLEYPNRVQPVFSYTLEDMMALIRAKDLRSIEELIPALPESYRSSYMLMYQSRSLQQASFLYPRVIMIGDDASFTLTFNGHRNHAGYDKIELMQFRPKTSSFELRELDFTNGRPVLSEANPAKCLKCHQSLNRQNVDPRPNWEPYNLWPGAYGSVDGKIYAQYDAHNRAKFEKNPADTFLYDLSLREGENLKKFETDIKPTHPRYSHLKSLDPRMTLIATTYFANLNFRRVSRLISENLDWERYKWLVTATMAKFGCGPSSINYAFSTNLGDLYPILSRLYKKKHPEDEKMNLKNFANVIDFLTLERGIDTSDWSMDFRTGGRLAFRERFGTPNSPRSEFARAFAVVFPELDKAECQDLLNKIKTSFEPIYLQNQTRLLLERSKQSSIDTPPRSPESSMQVCMHCHVGAGAVATLLPFDNLSQLSVKLNETGYPRGTLREEMSFRVSPHASLYEQMPPDNSLRADEADILIRFLKDL